MKTCYKCKREVPLDGFCKNRSKKDGLSNYCRDCNKVRSAQMYEQNKDYYIKKNNARTAKYRAEMQNRMWQYLLSHPCVDCREADPIVLEFDHVRGEKIESISKMVNRPQTWPTISAEIEKCDVRCANCHRRMTAKRGKWYAWLDPNPG